MRSNTSTRTGSVVKTMTNCTNLDESQRHQSLVASGKAAGQSYCHAQLHTRTDTCQTLNSEPR